MLLNKIVVPILLGITLFGMEFDEFYMQALKNSPYLQSNALGIDAAKMDASIETRYKNPTLQLEYSQFDANYGGSDDGHRVALSQPVRLWGVGDTRVLVANGLQREAKSSLVLTKALFSKRLHSLYVEYKKNLQLFNLAVVDKEIAKRVYEISKERYDNGAIAKVDVIQARLDYKLSQAKQKDAEILKLQSYYDLLAYAGLNEEVDIEVDYRETLLHVEKQSNPLFAFYHSKEDLAHAKEQLYKNRLEWVDVYAEYEKEPNDDIYRIGLSIPIALFNTKKEERQKARLEAKRTELLAENTNRFLKIKLKALAKQRILQKKLIKQLEDALGDGTELLELFEEGYRIANIDIVQLQQVKAALIKTKASLIEAKANLELNIIETNYLQGKYND